MDGGAFSQGYPLEIDDILQHTLDFTTGDHEIFAIPELEALATTKELRDDLYIPDLGAENGIGDRQLEAVDSDAASLSTDVSSGGALAEDSVPDIWTLDLTLGDDESKLRLWAWESFERKGEAGFEKPAYLSEAGPAAFDAVLLSQNSAAERNGVVPQDHMLAALCNLVLGRSSVFFQWDPAKTIFEETLRDTPTSGLSLECHRSLITQLVDCGSQYRTLLEYTSMASSRKQSCTALVAFKGCVTSILDAVESHITSQRFHVRSLLQLQALIDRPCQLLAILHRIKDSIGTQRTDEAIISSISDEVHQVVCIENSFAGTLQHILARVSKPWLEHLCADLRLEPNQMTSVSFQIESAEAHTFDGSELPSAEQSPPIQDVPGILSNNDRILVRETKTTLTLLQRHLPSTEFGSLQYQAVPAECMDVAHTNLLELGFETTNAQASLCENGGDEGLMWTDDQTQQDYLASLEARMSQPLRSTAQDGLQHAVASAFDGTASPEMYRSNQLDAALPFDPLQSLRPIIQSHASRVNRMLLEHLFERCNLRQHLDLQRQFHLLGNGDFVSRLTRALFSTETQSAERKRGRIPTAETMGLRLGARDGQTWPPASSEIQLTLMGILSETHRSTATPDVSTLRTKQLPGNLSFAIRELPEEEIEKVMDSASIHALDFLRLQYTPPPPLDAILTPTTMQAYDDIFRFLLKLVRVLHVTTSLREMYSSRHAERKLSPAAGERFSIQTHHFVTVLMSHFMDLGIEATWRPFQMALDKIERLVHDEGLVTASDTIGLEGLCKHHETCVEGMRTKLFLKRKQQKLRIAIENVLVAILKCASSLEGQDSIEVGSDFSAFQSAVTGLLTILRGILEKPAKDSGTSTTAEDDVEAMRLLLVRLTWNDHYRDVTV